MSHSIIGPVLPKTLKRKNTGEINSDDEDCPGVSKNDNQGIVGPVLPPHLINRGVSEDEESLISEDCPGVSKNNNQGIVGPVLPPHLINRGVSEDEESLISASDSEKYMTGESQNVDGIGPALPLHLMRGNEQENELKAKSSSEKAELCSESRFESDAYGPALPPHLLKRKIIGPCMSEENKASINVAALESDDEDYDVVGPLPDEDLKDGKVSLAHHQLELRARHLKRKFAEDSDEKEVPKRESWMLELPPEKARNLGLGPRSFRMKEGPDMSDRSSWTDTPADHAKKEQLAGVGIKVTNHEDEMQMARICERDKAMDELAEKSKKSNEKRQLSLLEMHQKEMANKKKKEQKEGKPERRPFDRNIDLQANRFDEAQKKSIFKKAQFLDSRFSQGQSKYL